MKYSKRIKAAVILLILLSPAVSAGMWWSIFYNTIPEVFEILSFGIMGIVEATSIMVAAMVQTNPCVYAGPDPTAQCPASIGASGSLPVDATIRSMNALFIRAFMPIYVTFFLILGLYMIFMQGSPKGRAEAKAFFIDLTVGMILVAVSPAIFQIILNISAYITDYIWSQSGVTFGEYKSWWRTRPDQTVYCCYFWIAIGSVICSLIVTMFRYFMVMIFGAIFPLAVFLYTFRFTKGMGNSLMKFSFLAVFSQVPMILFLVIGLKAYQDPSGWGVPAFRIMFGIAANLAIVCTPLIMLKVMNWIGGAVYAYSSRGGGSGVRFASQLMRGKGLGQALLTASGRYQTTHTLGMYERGGERMASPGWSKTTDGGGEFPGFPHRGIVGWSPLVYGKRGRMGRLRTGSTLSGAGGGERGARPVSDLRDGNVSGSLDGVTPGAQHRARMPTQKEPSPGSRRGGGKGAGGAQPFSPQDYSGGGGGGGVGGTGTGSAARATTGSPPGGGSPVQQSTGAPTHAMHPPGMGGRQQAPIAYSQSADTEPAEEAAAQAEGRSEAEKLTGDASGRIAAIQRDAEKRKLALELAAQRRSEGERSTLGGGLGDTGGEDEGAPAGGRRFTGQITPPRQQPKEPPKQTELPEWLNRAREMRITRSDNLKKLAELGPGRSNELIRDVRKAEKSGEYKGKTTDDLMLMALTGSLKTGDDSKEKKKDS